MNRREFPDRVKAQILLRATNAAGRVTCEGCRLVLGRKTYHFDHTIPEALFLDKSRELTADDGKLLGWDCCHKPKTAVDVGVIAKSKRRERKIRFGIKSRSARPIPGSKASGWKKPFNGPAERRT